MAKKVKHSATIIERCENSKIGRVNARSYRGYVIVQYDNKCLGGFGTGGRQFNIYEPHDAETQNSSAYIADTLSEAKWWIDGELKEQEGLLT